MKKEIKITKVGRKDYMGFSWFKIESDIPTYEINALDKEHALKIHKEYLAIRTQLVH
jgi:hypothetical protein